MPTLDIRITRILFMHITSCFDFDRSCFESGAVTPLHNTYNKRVFSMLRIDEQLFPRNQLVSVISFPEAPSITGLEHLSHQVIFITTPMLHLYATAVVDNNNTARYYSK